MRMDRREFFREAPRSANAGGCFGNRRKFGGAGIQPENGH
jgi:hypothetical protein